MPNHYDIDIECKECGRYIRTIYPDDDFSVGPEFCDKCKKKKLTKPKR